MLLLLLLYSRYIKVRFNTDSVKKGKGSPCSIAERRVPELIPVLGSQLAGDVSHKPERRVYSVIMYKLNKIFHLSLRLSLDILLLIFIVYCILSS